MKTILQTDYLWNNIRVRGGAYGAFFTVERSGAAMFATYRDPHVARSFDVIKNAGAFLTNIDYDDKAMHKFIIGTISSLDMPQPPLAIARRELYAYQSGISFQERLALRHEFFICHATRYPKVGRVVRGNGNTAALCMRRAFSRIGKRKQIFLCRRKVFD